MEARLTELETTLWRLEERINRLEQMTGVRKPGDFNPFGKPHEVGNFNLYGKPREVGDFNLYGKPREVGDFNPFGKPREAPKPGG
jgi:hypothetical protein